jgi:hypothetical protein
LIESTPDVIVPASSPSPNDISAAFGVKVFKYLSENGV